jgi:hypothetical protein
MIDPATAAGRPNLAPVLLGRPPDGVGAPHIHPPRVKVGARQGRGCGARCSRCFDEDTAAGGLETVGEACPVPRKANTVLAALVAP